MKRGAIGMLTACVALVGAAYFAFADGTLSQATLRTATGEHSLRVEVADTPKTREIGLMNRSSMPAGQGMLFDFDAPRVVTMWMKNTLIPLDMLFMDETGKVTRIAANAKPLSLDLIPSGPPARYVLELNGGEAARLGAAPGDSLSHGIISRSGG